VQGAIPTGPTRRPTCHHSSTMASPPPAPKRSKTGGGGGGGGGGNGALAAMMERILAATDWRSLFLVQAEDAGGADANDADEIAARAVRNRLVR